MPVTIYHRQKQILRFLAQYIQKNKFSPTLKEIAKAINVNSMATVHEHLAALEKKGIDREFLFSRSMLSPATCCLVNPDGEKTVEKASETTRNLSLRLREKLALY